MKKRSAGERLPIGNRDICTYQRNKQVIEYEIDGDEGSDIFARFPHREMHHLVPTLLGQYLEHGHGGLENVSAGWKTNKKINNLLAASFRLWDTDNISAPEDEF